MLIPADAATQHGCFTYPQAWAVGWTYGLLASTVRRCQLHHVRRGVWIEQAIWEHLSARDQHVVAVHADLLVLRSGWYADQRSAGAVLDLPLIGAMPLKPQLITAHTLHSVSPFRRSASLPPRHVTTRDGIPVTTMARTVVGFAQEQPFLDAVLVADAFLGLGLPRQALLDLLHDLSGSSAALEVIGFADGLSESALESLSRVRVHRHQLPPPELQVEVYRGNRLVARLDKLWREQRLAGEDDGMAKFGSTAAQVQTSLKQTYRRGLDIEDCGLALTRWDWNDAFQNGGAVVADRVRAGFLRGERTKLAPDVRFVPTTVEDRLRRESRLAG
ncbi:MAG: hypothetical protein JWO22_3352 [Frankiales bacterium]|nr:hypothetical protein [Frankiales bacterium]